MVCLYCLIVVWLVGVWVCLRGVLLVSLVFTALWLVEVFGLWRFIAGDYYAPDCLVLVVCMCNYLIVLVRCDCASLVLF